jgi:TPR repeat protein
MTVREILRLAIGGGIKFDTPPPDTETYAPAPPPPPPEFIESLRARAKAGEPEAQRELGILAYRGRGVPEDRCEAFKWLTLATRQGDAKAAQSLEFIGPTITVEEAHEGRVRICELTGEPPPPPLDDPDRDLDAVVVPTVPSQEEMYAQAIAAMRAQGLLEREETVIEVGADPDAPKYTFEPPPRPSGPPPPARPLAWALAGLALLVLMGTVAAVLFFLGRDQRDVARVPGQGTYSLQSGGVGKITLSTTVPELRAAAEQGNARAQFELGLAYARGVGIERDFAQAAEWYRKAALQRDIGAMNNLGVFYIQGTGVKQDFAQAYLWLHLAAQGGSTGSGRNRDQLSLYMTADQIAEAMRQAAAIRQAWSDAGLLGVTPPTTPATPPPALPQ